MLSYFIRRLAAAALLLFLLLNLLFLFVHLVPGDVTAVFDDPRLTEAQRDTMRRAFGLDRPLGERYVAWIAAVGLRWDWGTSFVHSRPVSRMIADTFPNTLRLAIAAFVVNLLVGVPLGIWAALTRGRRPDRAIRIGSLVVFSLPEFWLGLVSILLFAGAWSILPAGGMRSTDAAQLGRAARWLDSLRHLLLPAGILGLVSATATLRLLRNSLIEVMESDYIRTARGAGLPEWRVVLVHGLRNAVTPLLQYFGLLLPSLLNGAVIIEVVFAWPGLGRLMLSSIQSLDYPVVLAIAALTGGMVVIGNLLADLLHTLADPRLRQTR